MRHILAVSALIALTGPAAAQNDDSGGLSLMERGAQLFMEGILKEMEPALEGLDQIGPQLRSFAQEMGPALKDLLDEVQDWSAYHPPEILDNGDIIIRRKQPGDDPVKPDADGQIDL